MERITLSDQMDISRLVYGMMRITEDADPSPRHLQAKIEACLAQGMTTFDQADIYGGYESEAFLGQCLKSAPHLRAQMQIVTKCGIIAPAGRYADRRVKYYDTSSDHICQSVDTSLRLMHLDQIDLLLIHRPDPFMDHEDTGRALDKLISSGKVRAVGVSNFRPYDWELLQSAMSAQLVTNQIELSLSAPQALTNGDLAFLQQRHIPPMVWSPLGKLAGGLEPALMQRLQELADHYLVDIAAVIIAWHLAHPARFIPVLGSNRLDRISKFSDALNVQIDRQTWFELYTLAIGDEVP